MIPPYSKYKDSGIEWIGKIPAGWKVVPLKRLVAVPITDGPHETPQLLNEGIPFISAEAVKNGTLNFDLKRGYISIEDYKHFSQKCKPQYNDIFIVKSGASTGSIAKVNTHQVFSIWSPLALIRNDNHKINNQYMFHFLQSVLFQTEITLSWSYGTQQNIGMDVIGRQHVILPPLAEQAAIAAYLDKKLNDIDTAVSNLQIQAEKLHTYKQQLIAETVTRGLDKTSVYKDSGIEWIGKIPAGWKVVPLRAFLKIANIKKNGVCKLLSVERDRGVVDRIAEGSDKNHNRIPDDLSNYKTVFKGQFVINKMKAWQGSYGVSSYTGIVSPAYYVFDLGCLDSSFFNYAIRSTIYIYFFGQHSYGVRPDQWDLDLKHIRKILFALPPLAEQAAIAAYLDEKTTRIDTLITDIHRQIEQLKKYRKIIIHDAVTGRVKILEVQNENQ